MESSYIGVKLIKAWEEERDGKAGYAVKYEDGYTSWSPADVFERSYFRLSGEGDSLTENDITRFFDKVESKLVGKKTTASIGVLISGFEMFEGSSCVDEKNYNERTGAEICIRRMRIKVWELLGFVLQWAKCGIKREEDKLEM